MNHFAEIRNILSGKSVDVVGLMLFTSTVVLLLVGTLMAPFLIFVRVDPMNTIVQSLFPNFSTNSFPLYIALQTVTYLLCQWVTLESARVYTSIFLPLVICVHINLNCLAKIYCQNLNEKTFTLYDQLYCINQVVVDIGKLFAGALMNIGLLTAVFCNYVVIKCWNTLPTLLYVIVIGVLCVFYIVVDETVPYAIRCGEYSSNMLFNWRRNLSHKDCRRKYWRKLLAGKNPIWIRYALTKFEKGTEVNMYSSIVEYTVNLLIIA